MKLPELSYLTQGAFMLFRKFKLKISAVSLFALTAINPTNAEAKYYRETPDGWAVGESGHDSCGMLNKYEVRGRTTILFFHKYLDGDALVAAENESWSILEDQSYNVTYILNGNSYVGASKGAENGFGVFVDQDFERDLAVAGSLFMTLDDKIIGHLSLKGSSLALKYVNECVAILKRAQEAEAREKAKFAYIDEDPFATAKPMSKPNGTEPIPLSKYWATMSDYPSYSLANEHEGTSKFMVKVKVDGTVATCKIISSSGHEELDAATCKIVTRRAKFNPATDAKGSPVEGYFQGAVDWELPHTHRHLDKN